MCLIYEPLWTTNILCILTQMHWHASLQMYKSVFIMLRAGQTDLSTMAVPPTGLCGHSALRLLCSTSVKNSRNNHTHRVVGDATGFYSIPWNPYYSAGQYCVEGDATDFYPISWNSDWAESEQVSQRGRKLQQKSNIGGWLIREAKVLHYFFLCCLCLIEKLTSLAFD